ncbi:MAG: hypothetical protein ACKO7N_09775 [Candidatus Nitrosotenuis sp.]
MKILILIALFAVSLVSIDNAFAEEAKTPIKMKIGIEIMNIGEINKETGAYELFFWVSETSDDYDFTKQPPPIIDYENGYVEEITAISVKEHFYKFKARGTFFNAMDYREHPFNKLNLAIHIKSVIPNTLDNLQFEVDQKFSGIRKESFVSVPGWEIKDPYFFVSNQTYPWGEFSRFSAVVPVESSTTGVILKYFVPAILIAAFAFSTYWIPANYSDEKIEILAATLVGAIFYHVTYLSAGIPSVQYLTFADKVMLSLYTIFGMSLINVLLHKKLEHELKENYTVIVERKLNIKFRILTPIFAIIVLLITILF